MNEYCYLRISNWVVVLKVHSRIEGKSEHTRISAGERQKRSRLQLLVCVHVLLRRVWIKSQHAEDRIQREANIRIRLLAKFDIRGIPNKKYRGSRI
jgi:head-tail adaptor